MSKSLWPHGLSSPWNSPGQNTEVGNLSFLQGIFPNQGSNPGLPHYRCILNQLSHKESPRTLEWVAYPFFRGSSQPSNWTRVSCLTGRFFTSWVIRELHDKPRQHIKKQRRYFTEKGLYSQGYGFSSSHVYKWELDHKESWVPKKWCFCTVVLKKTFESPLDSKEIKPVNPKGNHMLQLKL